MKVFNRPDEAIRREIIDEVIVGQVMMDPARFFIQVHEGVAVIEGRVEQRSLIPYLVRAVHGVEGVVQVEDRLAYNVDDRDADRVMVSPWMRPWPNRRPEVARANGGLEVAMSSPGPTCSSKRHTPGTPAALLWYGLWSH